MPPRNKFTREEIIKASLDLTKESGISAVTARSLGEKLGVSSKPIFGLFENMAEVHRETIKEARKIYNTYVTEGLKCETPFKGVGTQYILFASTEPKLFQLLFMSEQKKVPNLSSVLPMIDENYEQILQSIMVAYSLSRTSAQKLYHHLWIYTHGIATLLATKMCVFTHEEISQMISEICLSLLKRMKEDEMNDKT